jgi:hypothetical protein
VGGEVAARRVSGAKQAGKIALVGVLSCWLRAPATSAVHLSLLITQSISAPQSMKQPVSEFVYIVLIVLLLLLHLVRPRCNATYTVYYTIKPKNNQVLCCAFAKDH